MANTMYASKDGTKLGIFEGDSNHLLMLEYIRELDVVQVSIMTGDTVEGVFRIAAHDNQSGRKYEGLLGLEHYCQRIIKMMQSDDYTMS